MKFFKANAAAAAAKATVPRLPGQKKSCDLCVFRKRKCDGAVPTCGFCLSRGSECHYSLRRPNRPRGYAKRLDEGRQLGVKVEGTTGFRNDSEEDESRKMQQATQQDVLAAGWKRIRLSASPATGLVGTKENAYLGSFFNCLGFLPLTHERLIRGTMMEMLLTSPSAPDVVHQASAEAAITPKAEISERACHGENDKSRGDAASSCALWCTIAMGALVQGQPPEQVTPYMHLAWASLSKCFDPFTVESGRAFLMMAYLYNFMRDDHKFCRYLHYAKKVVNRLPECTMQKQEIDDLVMMGDDTRIFHTPALEPSELDAYCRDESLELDVPDVIHKSDLCRLLLQADRRMMKAFLRDHRAQSYAPPEQSEQQAFFTEGAVSTASKHRGGDEQECQGREKSATDLQCPEAGEEGYLSGMSIKLGSLSVNSTRIDEGAHPSRPGDDTWKHAEETRKILQRLEQAAEAREIRAGVGSLLYNSILGYLDMVTGSTELEAGFEKAKHCAGIISRYPGLCRFSTWRHLSHCLLSFLSKIDDVDLFEELRGAYNSVNAEVFPVVPPCADWTMVGFCDHIFCRAMDRLEKNWGGLGPTELSTARETEGRRWLSEKPCWLHDTHENNTYWASVAPEFHCATDIRNETFPIHQWTDLMPADLRDASNSSAQPFQYVAVAPGFPAAVSHPVASINPAWSKAGHSQNMSAGDGATGGALAYEGGCRGGQSHDPWNSPAPAARINATNGAGAMRPRVADGSKCVSASTAQHMIAGKVVHSASLGGEQVFCRTSSSSTSETGGVDRGNDEMAEADETADRFFWWADPTSSNYMGDIPDG